MDVDKLRILSENKAKQGIYMFTHIASGKRYIGSSVDLRRRFLEYYNTKRLLRAPSMIINLALLKYGYSAFSLDILAYCDKSELMRKEKYFIDLVEPEYNILNDPGSPSRGSGWYKSEEAIQRIKDSKQNISPEVRDNMSKAQIFSQAVIVTDLVTDTKTTL